MGGEGEVYYEAEIEAMVANESITMFIDFSHVMFFNNLLQKAISDEFLRFEPHLKNACKRFVMERQSNAIPDDVNKDINGCSYLEFSRGLSFQSAISTISTPCIARDGLEAAMKEHGMGD